MRRINTFSSLLEQVLYAFIFLLIMNTGYLQELFPREMYILLLGCIIISLFMSIPIIKISKITICIICIYVLIIISTLIHQGNVISALSEIMPSLLAIGLFEILNTRNKLFEALKVFAAVGLLLIVFDLLSILLFPNGMYQTLYSDNWILGYKTARVRLGIPVLAFSSAASLQEKGSIRWPTYIGYIALFLSSLLTDSGMGTICVLISLILILLPKVPGTHHVKRLYDFRVWIVIIIIFSYTLYLLGTNEYINNIIIDMGRDPTFTGRTYIWDATLAEFSKSPLLGFGFIDSTGYQLLTGIRGGTQAHSLLLTIMGLAGVLGTILFFITIYFSFKGCKQLGTLSPSYIYASAFVVELIMGITSCNFYATFTISLLLLLDFSKT